MSYLFNTNDNAARYPETKKNYFGVTRLHDDLDRLFNSFFVHPEQPESMRSMSDFLPSLDVTSDEKAYTMKIELPGVAPEDVKITAENGVLTISGEKKEEVRDEKTKSHVRERSYGSFMRQMTLPDESDVDSISATSHDGVLCVAIPKKAPEQSKAKTIAIQKA